MEGEGERDVPSDRVGLKGEGGGVRTSATWVEGTTPDSPSSRMATNLCEHILGEI